MPSGYLSTLVTRLASLVTDVSISSPANNDVLRYNSSTGKWTNTANTPWMQLGRTTLGADGDTITVSSLTASTYLAFNAFLIDNAAAIQPTITFNGDTGNNYSMRASVNGGADTTGTSAASINPAISTANRMFWVGTIINVAAQEKILVSQFGHRGGAGAANAPAKAEIIGKWVNTTDQITSITFTNAGAGDFLAGSVVTVYGSN